MNERFRKFFISAMAFCCSILLLFPVSIRNVSADESDNESNITYIINSPYRMSKIRYNSTYPNVRIRLGSSSTQNWVTPGSAIDPTTIYAVRYTVGTGSTQYLLIFSKTKAVSSVTNDSTVLRADYSSDTLNWHNFSYLGGWIQQYTATWQDSNGTSYTGDTYYYSLQQVNNVSSYDSTQILMHLYNLENLPNIKLKSGQDQKSILYLFSKDDFSYLPWNFSTSSGGMHFEDGSDLSPENTSKYSQIFVVMDVNHDNSIDQDEVNYYNYTYHTNYDYSEINNGDNFDEIQFLNWIAVQIANGNDNPGGGTGEGGGSDVIGGGITVGDGSFTQSQTQTQSIAENAVNVTVNNDNSLNQDNTQWLNSVINNNLGNPDSVNAFENAIGSINGFTSIAHSFASLAGAVLSFLPAWVTTLLSLMFVILFVFIIFRLIHLFI